MKKMLENFIFYLYERHNLIILLPHPIAIGNCCEEIFEACRVATLYHKRILLILPPIIKSRFLPFKLLDAKLFDFTSEIFIIKPMNKFLFILRLIIWSITLPIILLSFILLKMKLKKPSHNFFPYLGQSLLFNLIKKGRVKKFSYDEAVSEKKKRESIKFQFKFSEETIKNVELFIRKNNIDSNNIVCLHVRTPSFYKNINHATYRNADILNYIDSINLLAEKGYFVIRIGDSGMPKIPENLIHHENKYFDLAHSDFNTAPINSWIVSICRFYVGMQSGPFDLARLYDKPILLTNMYTPFFGIESDPKSCGIYKKFENVQDNLLWDEVAVISSGKFNYGDFAVNGFNLIENNSYELEQFIECYLNGEFKNSDVYKIKLVQRNELLKKLIDVAKLDNILNDKELFRWVLRSIFTEI